MTPFNVLNTNALNYVLSKMFIPVILKDLLFQTLIILYYYFNGSLLVLDVLLEIWVLQALFVFLSLLELSTEQKEGQF